MPGPLLHVGAQVKCAHAGTATPAMPTPKVLIEGKPIVTQPGPWVVAGCTLPPPPAANGPCVSAMFTTAAVKVTSFGAPVLLMDSLSTCAPTGTPLIPIVPKPRVTGI